MGEMKEIVKAILSAPEGDFTLFLIIVVSLIATTLSVYAIASAIQRCFEAYFAYKAQGKRTPETLEEEEEGE